MPTLEEIDDVDDIDNMDFDPAEFDPRNPFSKSTPVSGGGANLQPVESTEVASTSSTSHAAPPSIPRAPFRAGGQVPTLSSEEEMEKYKHWQIVYPVYFDKSKSHAEGRRVPVDLAVENPLATNLMAACKDIGIHCIFEPQKTHPKDWSNPGRVRVLIRREEGTVPTAVPVNNKRHLYKLLGEYLRTHPTTERMPFQTQLVQHMRASGVGIPDKASPLAVPKGWQINSIVPVNSRVLSSGEENEEMMKSMQDKMFPGVNVPEQKVKKVRMRAR